MPTLMCSSRNRVPLSMSVAAIPGSLPSVRPMLMEELYRRRRHPVDLPVLAAGELALIVPEGRLPFLDQSRGRSSHDFGSLAWSASRKLCALTRCSECSSTPRGRYTSPLARLAQLPGRAGARPEVLSAFRDKHALKRLVRDRNLRSSVDAFREVRTARRTSCNSPKSNSSSRFGSRDRTDGGRNTAYAFF